MTREQMSDTRLSETRREANARQTTASQPSASFWVSANAGTGKTHVLTNRIVRLLMAGARPSQILCLTYTKAAATEMANRLGALLGGWAVMDDDALATAYRDQTGVPLDRDDLDRVRRLFAEVADTTDGPNIRTIHSFCESLLARFPLEAGVAPHFSVMDERTAAELRREARDRLLTRLAAEPDGPLAKAMDHVAMQIGEDGFDDLMMELDRCRGRLTDTIAGHGGLGALDGAVREALGIAAGDDRRTIILDPTNAPDREGLVRAVAALATGSAGDQERSQAIAAWLNVRGDEALLDGFGGYAAVFVTAAGGARKTLITKAAAKSDPVALDALLTEQARVLAVNDRLKALAVAENTAALAALAQALADAYADLKSGRALLDYDDLILRARDLLAPASAARRGAVAWVHFKLDGGIAHILVDEAQDTAPDQWEILKALADEFYAGEGAWEDRQPGGPDDGIVARTLFAVGDEKQSIYSFQGADPRGFDAARDHFARCAQAVGQEATLDHALEMAVSFRSTWPVLETVDRTFEPAEVRAALSGVDRPVRHLIDRDSDAGLVELWGTVTPEEEDEEDPWDAPVDRPGRRAPLMQVADAVAAQIETWLSAGEELESENRPLNPGDILILVRKRGRFMAEMVRALKSRGVSVSGSDRMILTEQLAVMDLIALGRFVLLPEDDLTLATVLKGPLFNFDDDADLTELCPGREESLWAELRRRSGEQDRWRAAAERLAALMAGADFAPPYEFYAALLGPGGGRREFHRHLGPDALDPIEEFLSLALQFEREHVPSLEGFLHWIGAGRAEVKRDLEQAGGQVRVMTVHGAKGLEAPVVFLPDTCQLGGRGRSVGLLWDGDLMFWPGRKADDTAKTRALRDAAEGLGDNEERRLLYVAMTRARDRLYVTGWEGKRGRAEGCWYDLIKAGLARAGADDIEMPDDGSDTKATPILLRLKSLQSRTVAPPTDATGDPDGRLPEWLFRPPPVEPDPPQPLAPSKPEDGPPSLSPLGDMGDGLASDAARFKRGLIVHALLQGLPDLPPDARLSAGRRYLARADLDLSQDEAEALLTESMTVLETPDLSDLFAAGSRAEVPLVALAGGRVISARLDRLVVTPDAVIVADFKTNRPPPVAVDQVPEVYLRQMAGYRTALQSIYTDKPIRMVLVWTVGCRMMELPDDLMDRYAP